MASDKFVGPMTAPIPLLKRLVTLTAQLNEAGGTFLTEAEANALYLKQASNLSDLSNVATARTNLGLSVLATTVPGTGIAAALAANVGSAGAPVLFDGALGTPASGTLTNTTGFPAANLAGTALPAAIVTSSLTTVGALNSGSITSGFGAIDIGTDTLAAGNTTITGTLSTTSTVNFGGAATMATDSLVIASAANANFALDSVGGSGRQWVQSSRTDGTYKVRDATGGTDIVSVATTGLSVTGTIVGSSTIQTSAGVAWNLGAANVVSPTAPNRTLTVTVGGTTYYIAAKTTND